ncbi:hypothetical protein C8F01DRAFT_303822 [Mycena amicta]|nr:hypothetical protein C8F01DRAFT_303822 [Mycena amicta]
MYARVQGGKWNSILTDLERVPGCESPWLGWRHEERRCQTPPNAPKNGKAKPPPPQKYVSPEELGLTYYERREGVHDRCGRDIVRFYCRENGKRRLVGGVSFDTFEEPILKILQDNHQLVRVNGIRRRDALARWSHIGDTTGSGTRQGNGGLPGDIYNAYAWHSGETPQDLTTLMRQALTLDLLVEATSPIFSGAAHQYMELCEDAELAHFGRYGLTSYHCNNFVSCVHCDRDVKGGCLHPCLQLRKENCSPDDFNFAYVE